MTPQDELDARVADIYDRMDRRGQRTRRFDQIEAAAFLVAIAVSLIWMAVT